MSKVDPKFLAEVERAGWLVHAVDQDAVIAACPRAGCALRTKLRSGVKVPETCRPGPDLAATRVTNFDVGRVFLRQRRENLGLTIREVEEIAGAATDHFAKAEKDNPSKIPNTEIFIEWAASLGYEVWLVPGQLSPYARRMIVDTRAQLKSRRTMSPHHAARRDRIKAAGEGPQE